MYLQCPCLCHWKQDNHSYCHLECCYATGLRTKTDNGTETKEEEIMKYSCECSFQCNNKDCKKYECTCINKVIMHSCCLHNEDLKMQLEEEIIKLSKENSDLKLTIDKLNEEIECFKKDMFDANEHNLNLYREIYKLKKNNK